MAEYIVNLMMIFCLGSWIIGLIELITIHSFSFVVFKIGIPIFKTSININTDNFNPEIDVTIRKEEGKFRFTSDNKVYFLSKFMYNKLFRFITPIPLKAVCTINKNTINIVARLPIGSSMFFIFLITFSAFISISFGIMFLVFTVIIIGTSYPIEKKRMKNMINELENMILCTI